VVDGESESSEMGQARKRFAEVAAVVDGIEMKLTESREARKQVVNGFEWQGIIGILANADVVESKGS